LKPPRQPVTRTETLPGPPARPTPFWRSAHPDPWSARSGCDRCGRQIDRRITGLVHGGIEHADAQRVRRRVRQRLRPPDPAKPTGCREPPVSGRTRRGRHPATRCPSCARSRPRRAPDRSSRRPGRLLGVERIVEHETVAVSQRLFMT
jgi:hypothetical protein